MGKSLGYIGTTGGEVCFNTGMTGYQEILTDPSYRGQIINMTYPHIGNYGVNEEDVESDQIQCSGFIVKQASEFPSNYRSTSSINDYLDKNRIVGIQEIDTRMITRMIRDEGAMNAAISSDGLSDQDLQLYLNKLPDMNGLDLAKDVSCKLPYLFNGTSDKTYKIAAIDFGIKLNILRILESHGCEIKVFPAETKFNEILAYNPDGVFLSNGPGDPSAMPEVIEQVKKITSDGRPVFGICLGHQALALSEGISTYKMHNGHRGINHPVLNLATGKAEVTSQNHGFGISEEDIKNSQNVEITHQNLNDDTIEGIRLTNKNCFSVQYHPESSPGPHDSRYLFDEFVENIKIYKDKN